MCFIGLSLMARLKKMVSNLFAGHYPLGLFFILTTAFIYTPSFLIYSSGPDSQNTFEWLPFLIIIISCLAVLLISLLLDKFFLKVSRVFNSICNSLALYLLITVLFFPVQRGVLDGKELAISQFDQMSHIAIFMAFFAISAASIYKPKLNFLCNKIVTILGIFTVLVTVYMSSSILALSGDADLLKRWQDVTILSPKNNIIIICFDGVQQDLARVYFEKTPQAGVIFEGFSFFTNTASAAPRTQLSLSAVMRGQMFSGKSDAAPVNDNLLNDLLVAGYSVSASPILCRRAGDVYNSLQMPEVFVESLDRKVLGLFFLGLNRYSPFIFKTSLQKEFGATSKLNSREAFRAIIDRLHVDFNIEKRMIYFHSMQTHFPVRFTQKGDISFDLTHDDVGGELVDTFSMVNDLLDRLKKLNIYDDAFIMFISDHGFGGLGGMKTLAPEQSYLLYPIDIRRELNIWLGAYQPLIMIKPPKASGPLNYQDTAVTLMDIRKTLNEFYSLTPSRSFEGVNMLDRNDSLAKRSVSIFVYNGDEFVFDPIESTSNWTLGELTMPMSENYTLDNVPSLQDLQALRIALARYHADHGAYPVSEGFDGLHTSWGRSGEDWIRGLVPNYLSKLPRDPRMNGKPETQYLYRSDGKDYKLISHLGVAREMVTNSLPELIDHKRFFAYGYWTAGAVNW